MTLREVIDNLEYLIGGDCTDTAMDFAEEIKMAIDCINKQIPQKPVRTDTQEIRYTDSYRCPSCGGGFTGTGIADYCYHCGQKLDWGDRDD